MSRRTQNGILRTTNGIVRTTDTSVTTALKHWWKFNNGSGSTATDYEGSLDGSINGATWVTDAKTGGYALDFDGTDDDVSMTNDTHTKDFSWTAWAKFDGVNDGTTHELILKPKNMYFECRGEGDGTLSFYMYDNNGNFPKTNTAVSNNTWIHLVGTWDESKGKMRLYKDGTQVDSNSFTKGDRSGSGDWVIGSNNGGNYFDGTIDDVRFYGGKLSDSEISTIYNNTK